MLRIGRQGARWVTLACVLVLGARPVVAACPGDCGNDGAVTVDDLVRGVSIALGSRPTSICPAADADGDGLVTITELVQAVNVALTGCSDPATPSSTASASPTETATPRATPSETRTPTSTPTETVTPTPTATAPPTSTPQRFTDVTDAAGLLYEHDYTGAVLPDVAQTMGGVAAGDFDGDSWTDLFVVTGDHPNLLLRNASGTFAPVAAPVLAMEGLRSSGPTFADFDGDGRLDLFVGVVEGGAPHLFRNLGGGEFEELTTSGLSALADRQNLGAAFGDHDRDGDLDLFISHWGTRLPAGGDIAYLWRNNGDRTFIDVSAAAGLPGDNDPGFIDQTLTPNFVDIDADGWLDLLVATDFGRSAILRNRRDGTFSVEPGEVLSDENGKGAAVGDYDNDGDLDWFVSGTFDSDGVSEGGWGVTGNRLYRNDGDGTFSDATDAAGVRDGSWGWGACFADFDNDGWLDLFQVNGWGLLDLGNEAMPVPGTEQFRDDPARLFMSNRDGTFRERAGASGVADRSQGRGVVCFDYDRDGDVDLFIANNGGPPKLFRNDFGNAQHWLAVSLRGPAPNTDGIGARVYATAGGQTQMRELRAGSNFVSQDPALAHFGLGAATIVDELRIAWPNGETTTFTEVAADRYLVVLLL